MKATFPALRAALLFFNSKKLIMKKMLTAIAAAFVLFSCNTKSTEPSVASDSTKATGMATAEIKPAEIADSKYMDIGKRFLANFSKGDIDTWLNDYADSAVFVWNSGDSLKGKAAIGKYWKGRWTGLESISFTNDIWLPLQVNKPQSVEAPGTWLLGWYMFNEKFKNGKSVVEWAHDDMHLDANGKVDRTIHYVDMAPVKAALGK